MQEHQHGDGEGSAAFPHNNLTDRDVAGVHPTIEAAATGARYVAEQALSAAATAGSNASTALAAAEGAAAVTDAIQDGGGFALVTADSKRSEERAQLVAARCAPLQLLICCSYPIKFPRKGYKQGFSYYIFSINKSVKPTIQ